VARYEVRARPGSRNGVSVERGPDAVLTVRVKERAVDGAANEAIVAALATHFGVRRADVRILRGLASRVKLVEVDEP
jgi:uncharacterized protein YggU (UPF0235/DUF167 family)